VDISEFLQEGGWEDTKQAFYRDVQRGKRFLLLL